jgi:hypothetical protein
MKKLALAVLAVGLLVVSVGAQTTAPVRHFVGRSLGGGFHPVAGTQFTEETVTLKFGPDDNAPDFMIDFITRIADHRPAPPGVVDLIVTELHAADDRTPAMTLRTDDRTLPLPTRLHGRRSVATTMTFEDFEKLIASTTIVEQAFDADLEFSAGQIRMLRATVDRWMGR